MSRNKGKTETIQKNPIQISFFKKHRNTIFLCLLLLTTFFVFSGSLHNGFTNWDDNKHITENADIKNLSFKSIKTFFSSVYLGMYHPLTTLSFAVEYRFFGLNPMVYHLANILLHLLNVVLVFYFVKSVFKNFEVAFFTACIMAIHPMHTESVCWITERKDVLYSLFFLVSLLCYMKSKEQKKYLIFSYLFFFFSLFSKSAAIVLPLVLILIDYYIQKKITKKKFIAKIPFFILSIIFGVVSLYSQNVQNITYEVSQNYHFIDKIFISCYSLSFYIIQFFVPFALSVFHAFPDKINGFLPVEYYVSPLLILGIIFLLIKFRPVKPMIIMGLLFFIINVFLILQWIQIGYTVVGERYTYLAYIGLSISVFFIGKEIAERWKISENKSAYLRYFLIFYGLVFCYLSYGRNAVWKDSISVWDDAIESDNTNSFAYFNRGFTKLTKKKINEAIADFTIAISCKPDDVDSYTNRGIAKTFLNDYQGAVDDYTKALQIKKSAELFVNRGNARDQISDFKGAVDDYTEALKLSPENPTFYYFRGISYENMNHYSEALADYDIALKLKTDYVEVYIKKGKIKLILKDFSGAETEFRKGLKIDSKKVEIYNLLGNLKMQIHDNEDALAEYSQAIAINPNHTDAYVNRGNLKFDMLDIQGSIDDYSIAIKINPNFYTAYFNRAMSRVSLGDLPGALQDYDVFVKGNPESALGFNNRGTVKINQKNYTSALDDFKTAISLNVNYAEAYKNKAIAEYYLNDKISACDDIKKAASLGSAYAAKIMNNICR